VLIRGLVFGIGTLQPRVPTRRGRSGTRDDRPGRSTPYPPTTSPEGEVKIVTTATKVALKPLEDRVVVQPLDAEQTTASGLVIPDTAKEKPQEGVVLAVGPGRFDEDGEKRIPLDVKVGDVVLYSKYGGTEVKYNNEDYLVLSARDLLAIVEK
jgi:chaperonin GroES